MHLLPVLAVLSLPPARAADRVQMDLDVWLPTHAEPGPDGWSSQPVRLTVGASAPGAPADTPGNEVDDGSLTTTCSLVRGSLELSIAYVPARYPEHLPEELRCSVGPVDAHVHVVPRRPLYTDPAQLRVDPATGVEVRRYVLTPGTSASEGRAFALPSGVTWVADDAAGSRRGTRCTVHPGARPILMVSFDERTPDGVGRCRLTDGERKEHLVAFRVVSVPPEP